MVVYYHGEKPLVILTSLSKDPLGGPAIREHTIMLEHGQGIDLDIIGLSPDRPFNKEDLN